MRTTIGTTARDHSSPQPRTLLAGGLLFLMLLFLFIAMSGDTGAEVHTVDESGGGDFTTIQEAVDAAGDGVGDVVLIRAGSYAGNVTVDKTLTISGESREEVNIGSAEGVGFHVTGDNVTIENLTISGFRETGVLLESDDNTLSHLAIRDIGSNTPLEPERGYGILLTSSHHNTISSTHLEDIGKNGPFGRGGVALRFQSSDSNTVQDITIDTVTSGSDSPGFPGNGMELLGSHGNRLTRVGIMNVSSTGVWLEDSEENVIEDSSPGAFLFHHSTGNSFHNNTFSKLLFPETNGKEDYDNLISESNTILGEPVLYLFDDKEREISAQGEVFGLIVAAWCSDLVLKDGLSVYEGALVIHSSGITFQNFSFATTREEALLIEHSSTCLVRDSLFLSEYRWEISGDIENATGRRLDAGFTPDPRADSYFSPKGIVVNESLSSSFTGNMFFYNETDALSVTGSSQITIQGNNFSKELNLTDGGDEARSCGTGVSLSLCLQSTVTDNVFFKYKYGLSISESQDLQAQDNRFLGNQFSVRSYDSSFGAFRNNTLRNSELGYLFVGSFTRSPAWAGRAGVPGGEDEGRGELGSDWNTLEGGTVRGCDVGVRVRDSLLQVANGSFANVTGHTVEVYEAGIVILINTSSSSLSVHDAASEIRVFHVLQVIVVNKLGAGIPGSDVEVRDCDDGELVFYRSWGFGGTDRTTGHDGKLLWIPVLSAVLDSSGTTTHVVTVRARYSDFTAIEERLSVEALHKLTMVILWASPLQTRDIPDDFSLPEDSTQELRIDLAPYFTDELQPSDELVYGIVSLGGENEKNATKAELEMVDGHILSVALNHFTGKDWYGYLEDVVVSATDSDFGLTQITQSNPFTISVLPLNDPPTLEVDESFMNSGVTVQEDTAFWLELTVTDVDTPVSELQVMTNDSRASYIEDNSTLELLFPEGSSSTILNISVSDGVGEICFLEFDVHFTDVNDRPSFSFLMPAQEGVDTFLISWLDEDVDSPAVISLYYDTDSTGEDGTLIADNILEDAEGDSHLWDLSEVAKGYYYLYSVIQDEEHREVLYHPGRIRVSHSILSFSPGSIRLEPANPGKGDDVIVRGVIENSGDVDVVDAVLSVYLDHELRDEFVLSGTFPSGDEQNFELYLGTLESTGSRITLTYRVPPGGERNLTELTLEAAEDEEGAKSGGLPGFELYGVLAAVGVVVCGRGLRKKGQDGC